MFAEVNTGIILTPEGVRHIGQENYYLVFETENDATVFAESYVQHHPLTECLLRDENGNHIRFIRNIN
jgi:hypothetical protein